MSYSLAARLALGVGGLALLASCASEPQSATQAAAPPPTQLETADVSLAKEQRVSREAQLQTPLDLPPEATGGPPPETYHASGMDVGAPELLAGGADISPDVRVWQQWPAGTRQIYGPAPTPTNPILTPVAIPTQ